MIWKIIGKIMDILFKLLVIVGGILLVLFLCIVVFIGIRFLIKDTHTATIICGIFYGACAIMLLIKWILQRPEK